MVRVIKPLAGGKAAKGGSTFSEPAALARRCVGDLQGHVDVDVRRCRL